MKTLRQLKRIENECWAWVVANVALSVYCIFNDGHVLMWFTAVCALLWTCLALRTRDARKDRER